MLFESQNTPEFSRGSQNISCLGRAKASTFFFRLNRLNSILLGSSIAEHDEHIFFGPQSRNIPDFGRDGRNSPNFGRDAI